MARDHFITPVIPSITAQTVRLGSTNTPVGNLAKTEENKLVKLVSESCYDLVVVGNEIEAQIMSVENALQNAWTIGSIQKQYALTVTFDGLQATPGVGVVAIGDIVVAGTPVAKGTAQTGYPKVCTATTPANVVHKYRVVSLGTAGSGAVGTVGVIERI